MPLFGVSVAAGVVAVVLVLAVAERFRTPGALPAALAAHRVVPARAVRPVAVAVTVAEVLLTVSLVAGLVRGAPQFPLAGAAVLFAGYGAYAGHVTASGRSGPCGCGGTEVPMGHWVTGRALVLAALAALAAATHRAVGPVDRFDSRLLLVLLASVTLGTLLWHLPAAMHVPAAVRHREVVR